MARRIVMPTIGSYGDIHPFLAIGIALKDRGHDVVIVTSPWYEPKIRATGLGFAPMRPDKPDFSNQAAAKRYMDMRYGTERIFKEIVMPGLRQSYDDLMAATRDGDVIVSHMLALAAPIVAELRKLTWISTVLQPIGMFSAEDPSIISVLPALVKARALGAGFYRAMFDILALHTVPWTKTWHALRKDLGLPKTPLNPLLQGAWSPTLVLALFSEIMAAPQSDWPKNTVVTGFPFYDDDGDQALPRELAAFLDRGDPPLVFTLGTAAVYDASAFYDQSLRAARALGKRAVLLVGKDAGNTVGDLRDDAIAVPYAPFSKLFPRAAANVHQGGIGTTGQALQSGRPMLVMPYSHDQPDNAARVVKLGVARTLAKKDYNTESAARELGLILRDPRYATRAKEVGDKVAREDGAKKAAEAIERLDGNY